MQLLTDDLRRQLLANGSTAPQTDHIPVVKFFDPTGAATWIVTELMPAADASGEPDILFGLCDLGFGCPELGYVSLTELAGIKGRLGPGIERDLQFRARFPLSVYARAALIRSRVVESEKLLAEAARALGLSADPVPEIPPPNPQPGDG